MKAGCRARGQLLAWRDFGCLGTKFFQLPRGLIFRLLQFRNLAARNGCLPDDNTIFSKRLMVGPHCLIDIILCLIERMFSVFFPGRQRLGFGLQLVVVALGYRQFLLRALNGPFCSFYGAHERSSFPTLVLLGLGIRLSDSFLKNRQFPVVLFQGALSVPQCPLGARHSQLLRSSLTGHPQFI